MKKFDLLKYLMLLLVGMAFALNASAARGQWVLQLWDRDGAPVGQYALTMSPSVTFTEDQVVVTNDVADVFYYALPTMWKFTYYFDPGSGIKDITAENNAMTFDGNVIIQWFACDEQDCRHRWRVRFPPVRLDQGRVSG